MSEITLGYCTNVHAGADLDQTRANLERYAVRVREHLHLEGDLPIGLWLSASAASRLRTEDGELPRFRDWLAERHLRVFTINGFPFGDFHRDVVKHDVYRPTWAEDARKHYTIDLAEILAALLPAESEGSISTLPLGWPEEKSTNPPVHKSTLNDQQIVEFAWRLRAVADHLSALESVTGTLIHLDIEPEPGCILDTSDNVIRFFEDVLLAEGDEATLRRHIRICHDVCHAAVMFEDQREVIERYRKAGIAIGKVQLSNAIRADLRNRSARERTETIAALQPFSEDRYLHQTMIDADGAHTFFEDLPLALNEFARTDRADDEWRIHYHLPLFVDAVGPLGTTQDAIVACLSAIEPADEVHHFEVETYTWDVLPKAMREVELTEGIARELQWARLHMT